MNMNKGTISQKSEMSMVDHNKEQTNTGVEHRLDYKILKTVYIYQGQNGITSTKISRILERGNGSVSAELSMMIKNPVLEKYLTRTKEIGGIFVYFMRTDKPFDEIFHEYYINNVGLFRKSKIKPVHVIEKILPVIPERQVKEFLRISGKVKIGGIIMELDNAQVEIVKQ